MLILGFIFTNKDGELLFSKCTAFSKVRNKMNETDFLKYLKINARSLECLVQLDHNYFLSLKINDVWVSFCFEKSNISPIFIVHKIQKCVTVTTDHIGEFNEVSILHSIGMVCDIFTDIISDCEINLKNYSTVWTSKIDENSLFSMLPANLFGSKSVDTALIASSDSSKQPMSYVKDKTMEGESLFIDLLEEIKLIVDENGATLHSNISGKMLVKSYSPQSISLLISFSDNLKYGETRQCDVFSNSAVLSRCQFQEFVNKNEFPKSLKLTAEQGSNPVFNYGVEIAALLKLPFTMYSSTTLNGKMISLELKFHCNTDPQYAPINFRAFMHVPSNTISLSAKSSLQSIKFNHCRDESLLEWTSDLIPGQSHHSVSIVISVSEINSLSLLELSSVNLCFEIPSLCVSGVSISNVKIQNNLARPVKKWARCLTFTKNYQFLLKHQNVFH